MKIVINSCQKYHEVLKYTLDTILKSGITDEIIVGTSGHDFDFNDTRVRVFDYGVDSGWSTNLLKLLDVIHDEYVILTMDDLAVSKAPPRLIFDSTISSLVASSYDSVSLYAPPSSRIESSLNGSFTWLTQKAPNKRYPVSCMFTLIKVDFLRSILNAGESAWDFEHSAAERINMNPEITIAELSYNLVDLKNLVIKGLLVKERVSSDRTFEFKNMSKILYFRHVFFIIAATIKAVKIRSLVKFLVH